jgi:hypothetical protein
MLTVAEETLKSLTNQRNKQVITHLYGQEINPETFAICKADILPKGEGENADHTRTPRRPAKPGSPSFTEKEVKRCSHGNIAASFRLGFLPSKAPGATHIRPKLG